MKSPFTGKEMELRRKEEKYPFRGEEITVIAHFYYCNDTKEEVTTEELDTITINQLYNKYRDKYNIPFAQEIIELKNKYEVSNADMAEILGFGANTYGKYERGEVPSRSNGKTLQLIKNTAEFQKLVELADTLGTEKKERILEHLTTLQKEKKQPVFDSLYSISVPKLNEEPSHKMGYQALSWNKIKAMIRYFSHLEPFTVKLNKLMFYADFSHYKHTGFSISGIPYRAIAMGPVPAFYSNMYEYLVHIEAISVRSVVINGNVGKQYYIKEGQEFEQEELSESEYTALQKVKERFKDVSTSEIIELSHQEQAWQAHQVKNEIIDYNHAFYLKHL